MQTHHEDERAQETPLASPVLSGFSPYDDDPDTHDLFSYYTFERILQYVKEIYPQLQEADAQDIAEEVHISLWAKLQNGEVFHPKTYIARMIHNKYIDHWRKNQRHVYAHLQILPLTDVQETLENEVVTAPGEGMADPAKEFERKEAMAELLTGLVEAFLDLPPRQQRAMFCLLLENIDEPYPLVEICRVRNIDIRGIHWPAHKADKQLLKASLHAARLFLARRLSIDLLPRKRKRGSQAVSAVFALAEKPRT